MWVRQEIDSFTPLTWTRSGLSIGSQGAGKKKKLGTPVVGGWVRVRKRTRVRFIFSMFFYRVFELPSSRNAQNFWVLGLGRRQSVVSGFRDNLGAITVAVLGMVVDEALGLKLCLF
jgi:hypothetical protein